MSNEVNEVKKILYKEKPMARWLASNNDTIFYSAVTSQHGVIFAVPKHESATFSKEEPAQLLIRWIEDIVPITQISHYHGK